MTTVRHLFLAQKEKCFYCGVKLKLRAGDTKMARKATRDHFEPKKNGGPSKIYNYVLACAQCNNGYGCELPTDDEREQFKLVHEEARRLHHEDITHRRAAGLKRRKPLP